MIVHINVTQYYGWLRNNSEMKCNFFYFYTDVSKQPINQYQIYVANNELCNYKLQSTC